MSLASAEAITLGQSVDLSKGPAAALRSTGVCVELTCEDVVIAKIDDRTTYLGGLTRGAFTYLVDGKVAMVGWVGRAFGESPLSPAPSQFNRLSQKVAGVAMPKSWWNATWRNYDNSVGLYPGRVPRVVTQTAIFDTKVRPWETIYIAVPAHEKRLRALINRVEPQNARAISERFVKEIRGSLSNQLPQCPAGTQPLMSATAWDRIWESNNTNKIEEFFKQRAMPAVGCCGAPASYSLPGLSASVVTIEDRRYIGDAVIEYPNVCASGVGNLYDE